MTKLTYQDTLLTDFRDRAKRGEMSTQTYMHIQLIITGDAVFDVAAELLTNELLQNTITMSDAYAIMSCLDIDALLTINHKPASSLDIDRYKHYLAHLENKPNEYKYKKEFAFEVFGYIWSELNQSR